MFLSDSQATALLQPSTAGICHLIFLRLEMNRLFCLHLEPTLKVAYLWQKMRKIFGSDGDAADDD